VIIIAELRNCVNTLLLYCGNFLITYPPDSVGGRGKRIRRGVNTPLERPRKGLKRDKACLIIRALKRDLIPLYKYFPPLLEKERGFILKGSP